MKKIKNKKHYFQKFMKLGLGVKIFLIIFFIFFVFEAILNIYPFVWVINNALKTTTTYYETTMDITTDWDFKNFLNVFDGTKFYSQAGYDADYFDMLFNAVWQTGLYLVANLLSSFLVAYALSKFRFPGKEFLYAFLIFTQTIPIIGSGVAAYKMNYSLGFVNNPYTIWILWSGGFDYSAFILYGMLNGISKSYSESAKLDGASELKIMTKVIFPQVTPVLAALAVTNFVARWNDYTTSQIYLPKYPNLAYGLFTSEKLLRYADSGLYYSAIILIALPGVILYACAQNLILKNISIGGLKG